MSKIISKSRRIHGPRFYLEYFPLPADEQPRAKGSMLRPHDQGYSIPCDSAGVPDRGQMSDYQRRALLFVQQYPELFRKPTVRRIETGYTVPMRIKCDCGVELDVPAFTNTCYCGRDYNSCGQLLAPRSQWGEETGESAGDILTVGHYDVSGDVVEG